MERIETIEQAYAAANALAKWGRERADQSFEALDALEDYMAGAVMAQVTDPDYEGALASLEFEAPEAPDPGYAGDKPQERWIAYRVREYDTDEIVGVLVPNVANAPNVNTIGLVAGWPPDKTVVWLTMDDPSWQVGFVTVAERDEWLERNYPERQLSESPGLYNLPGGDALRILGNTVRWLPAPAGRAVPVARSQR